MPTVTVENLAKMIGSESEALLSQMKEAGLSHTDVSDEVTDQDKKTLLEFLKNQQTKSTKTISLNKKTSKADLSPMGVLDFNSKKSFLMDYLLKDSSMKYIVDREKLKRDFFGDSTIKDNNKILPVYDLVALKIWLKNEMLEIDPVKLSKYK